MFSSQLPDLVNLAIGPKLLGNPTAMQHMVNRCPKLRRLVLLPPGDVENAGYGVYGLSVQPGVLSQSLGALAALTGLHELLLTCVNPPMNQEGWAALAACSSLVDLTVGLDARSPLGVLQGMTKLRQLTRLVVMASFEPNAPPQSFNFPRGGTQVGPRGCCVLVQLSFPHVFAR
jgi:hypothetical protein